MWSGRRCPSSSQIAVTVRHDPWRHHLQNLRGRCLGLELLPIRAVQHPGHGHTATAVIINLVVIILLDEVYGCIARWLTKIGERPGEPQSQAAAHCLPVGPWTGPLQPL